MKYINQKQLKKSYNIIINKLFKICNRILIYYDCIYEEDIIKLSFQKIEDTNILSTQFMNYGFDKYKLFKFDYKAFTFFESIDKLYELYEKYGIGEVCFYKDSVEYAEFSPCENTPFYILECEEFNYLL